MAKVFDNITDKLAFLDLYGNACITEGGKNFDYMLGVFFNGSLEYDYVVDVHEAGFPFERG